MVSFCVQLGHILIKLVSALPKQLGWVAWHVSVCPSLLKVLIPNKAFYFCRWRILTRLLVILW
jgi:hypothetical protein